MQLSVTADNRLPKSLQIIHDEVESMRWALVLSLIVACVACKSQRGLWDNRSDRPEFVISIPDAAQPLLNTNQVIQIARETAISHKFKLNDYQCDSIIFQRQPAEGTKSNEWLVHFQAVPVSPDMDFFVSIEDKTGKGRMLVR